MKDTGPNTPLSADALDALAQGVYGQQWQSAMARDMEIALRTVQRWAADGIGKPVTADRIRIFLDERRKAVVPGPETGADLAEVLGPRVEALVAAAEAAGWDREEAVEAISDRLSEMQAKSPSL